jgi:hypothetical protein
MTLPRTDHLRNQIEQHDDEASGRGDKPDGSPVEPERGGIGERIASEIAHPLRHQEQNDRPAREEAEGVQEPVEAVGIDEGGDPEEGGGRQKVAGDRKPVLNRRDRVAGAVEIGFRFRPAGRAVGDDERGDDDEREHGYRDPVRPVCARHYRLRRGRERTCRDQRGQEISDHRPNLRLSLRASSSKRELERWT